MKKLLQLAGALTLMGAASAQAQMVAHIGNPKSPIASVVLVPQGSDTAYVSGMTGPVIDPKAPPGTKAAYGDTKTQTIGALKALDAALKAQGFSLADSVMMRVYLVADPDTGKMDFAGMMAGYLQFFGTPEQPNKPSRVTIEVAHLVGPGALVEIEVQAAKAKK